MSNVWHKPSEIPDVFKPYPIIVVYEAGDQIEQMDSKEYSDLVGKRYVNRWCYVDDLIKENDRTRKALEVAVDALREIHLPKQWCPVFAEQEIAKKALDEITALEQKDVK